MQWEMKQITSRPAGEVNTIPWTCPSRAAEGKAPIAGHDCPVWIRDVEFDPEQTSLTLGKTMEHCKDLYQNQSKAVWWWKPAGKIETGGEKGKTRRGLCPLYLLGLIGSRCSWKSRNKWSLRRQKAEHSKPSPHNTSRGEWQHSLWASMKYLFSPCLFKDYAAKMSEKFKAKSIQMSLQWGWLLMWTSLIIFEVLSVTA